MQYQHTMAPAAQDTHTAVCQQGCRCQAVPVCRPASYESANRLCSKPKPHRRSDQMQSVSVCVCPPVSGPIHSPGTWCARRGTSPTNSACGPPLATSALAVDRNSPMLWDRPAVLLLLLAAAPIAPCVWMYVLMTSKGLRARNTAATNSWLAEQQCRCVTTTGNTHCQAAHHSTAAPGKQHTLSAVCVCTYINIIQCSSS